MRETPFNRPDAFESAERHFFAARKMRAGAIPGRIRELTGSGYGRSPDRRGSYRAARLRMAPLTPPELQRGDHLLANGRPFRLLRGGRLTGSLKPARGLQASWASRERPTPRAPNQAVANLGIVKATKQGNRTNVVRGPPQGWRGPRARGFGVRHIGEANKVPAVPR